MTATEAVGAHDRVRAAAQAYIYGYPVVYDLKSVAEFAGGGGGLPIQAPVNEFGCARGFLPPETKFVSPNNDTPGSGHPVVACGGGVDAAGAFKAIVESGDEW